MNMYAYMYLRNPDIEALSTLISRKPHINSLDLSIERTSNAGIAELVNLLSKKLNITHIKLKSINMANDDHLSKIAIAISKAKTGIKVIELCTDMLSDFEILRLIESENSTAISMTVKSENLSLYNYARSKKNLWNHVLTFYLLQSQLGLLPEIKKIIFGYFCSLETNFAVFSGNPLLSSENWVDNIKNNVLKSILPSELIKTFELTIKERISSKDTASGPFELEGNYAVYFCESMSAVVAYPIIHQGFIIEYNPISSKLLTYIVPKWDNAIQNMQTYKIHNIDTSNDLSPDDVFFLKENFFKLAECFAQCKEFAFKEFRDLVKDKDWIFPEEFVNKIAIAAEKIKIWWVSRPNPQIPESMNPVIAALSGMGITIKSQEHIEGILNFFTTFSSVYPRIVENTNMQPFSILQLGEKKSHHFQATENSLTRLAQHVISKHTLLCCCYLKFSAKR